MNYKLKKYDRNQQQKIIIYSLRYNFNKSEKRGLNKFLLIVDIAAVLNKPEAQFLILIMRNSHLSVSWQ